MTAHRRSPVRRSARARVAFLASLVALAAAPASAQGPPASAPWTYGTTLNVFGGAAVDSAHTGAAGGAAFGWELTRRLSFEASATWLARGAGANGFAADFATLFNLTPPRRLVPFVKGGLGLYRASFDPTRSPMPGFYAEGVEAADVFERHAVFTNPAVVTGGGINLWLGEHFSLRPELDLRIVTRVGGAHPIMVAAVRVAYHFEDHPLLSR